MKRPRLAIVTALATVGLLIPSAADAATATPHSASSSGAAGSWSLAISRPASLQHKTKTILLSPSRCAAVKRQLARAHPDAAPLRRCEVGIGLVVGKPRRVTTHSGTGRHDGASTWYYNTVTSTMCYGDSPIWGKANSSFSCAEGWMQVVGQYHYNGYNAWYDWVSCADYYLTHYVATISITWCGAWNNGAGQPYGYMDLGANGTYTSAAGSLGNGTMWMRIDIYYWGLLQLRGGWAG